MKLLILLTFCLGFVACIPRVIFIGPAPIPKSYQSGHVLLPYNEIGPHKIPNILRSGRSGPKMLRRNRRNRPCRILKNRKRGAQYTKTSRHWSSRLCKTPYRPPPERSYNPALAKEPDVYWQKALS